MSHNPSDSYYLHASSMMLMIIKPKIINKKILLSLISPKNSLSASLHLLDLCSSDVAEVEIFSLIEEQIPKYKVRADRIINFTGTSNQVRVKNHVEFIWGC